MKLRNLTHNHVLNEANYLADSPQRHLGTFERNRMRELCLYNCPSSDIKELEALAKAGELRPHWNENNELECISFATREQIDLFQRFPELIGIDATYNTNRFRYLFLSTSMSFAAFHFFRSL